MTSDPQRTGIRIKILHLITSLEVGGAQHGLLLGLPRFDPQRYEHIICSITDRMHMSDLYRAKGIEVRTLGLSSKLDLSVAFRLRSLLRELQPDILHTYLLHGNVLGRIVGRLTGVPTIIGSERTIGQARRWGRLATKLTNPLTDAVEVNSNIGAAAIEKDLGVPSQKIEVVRSGLDIETLASSDRRNEIRGELNLEPDQHLVVFAGRLRPVKGIVSGVEAFAKATKTNPNLHLAIAGEGEQRAKLESLAQKLEAANHITFLGVRNDIPDLLSAADSILIPSLNEGFPRLAIEAMAAGKPIIATNVGGTPEAIDDGVTGILVPAKEIDAMADAVLRLADDPDWQAKLGEAGRKKATANYSVHSYVSRLIDIYTKYSTHPASVEGTHRTMDSSN